MCAVFARKGCKAVNAWKESMYVLYTDIINVYTAIRCIDDTQCTHFTRQMSSHDSCDKCLSTFHVEAPLTSYSTAFNLSVNGLKVQYRLQYCTIRSILQYTVATISTIQSYSMHKRYNRCFCFESK